MPPLVRRFTRALPAALDTFANATDDITGLTFVKIAQKNKIVDMVNDPDPAAGLRYENQFTKEGIQTGRGFFSTSLSSASAGRIDPGGINLSMGNYFFSVAQRAGALAAYSFIVKFEAGF
ncbi:MAG: hypothetical protein L0Y56_10690 [Nitrospira sp.]|nr:hypothetical protein [Nitrospira sp.]